MNVLRAVRRLTLAVVITITTTLNGILSLPKMYSFAPDQAQKDLCDK